jgi:hypothetical protein
MPNDDRGRDTNKEGQATHEHDKRSHTCRGIKTMQPGTVALYCKEPGLAAADVHTGVKLVEHRVRHLHVDKRLLVDIAAEVFVVVAAEPVCRQGQAAVTLTSTTAKTRSGCHKISTLSMVDVL